MSAQEMVIKPMRKARDASLQRMASSALRITDGDAEGIWHGMVVTSAGLPSISPKLVWVETQVPISNYPFHAASGHASRNPRDKSHRPEPKRISHRDMGCQHATRTDGRTAAKGGAITKIGQYARVCTIVDALACGSHTGFGGKIDDAIPPNPIAQTPAPILWLGGERASVASRPDT